MIYTTPPGETILDADIVTSAAFTFQGNRYFCRAITEPPNVYCRLRDRLLVRHRMTEFYESGGLYVCRVEGTDDSNYLMHFESEDVLHNIAVVMDVIGPARLAA